MPKTVFTYGLLDERLRTLGFTVHTQKEKARIYKHEQMGASIILPDAPLSEEVFPHHLAIVRHVLKEYNIGGIEGARDVIPKTYDREIDMASDKAQVEAYFKQVLQDYNCGDIRELLKKELDRAGPLLACTVNGIDTVGGMMLGFSEGSRKRSIALMQQHLLLTQEDADLLYKIAEKQRMPTSSYSPFLPEWLKHLTLGKTS